MSASAHGHSQPPDQRPILFYSNHCAHCRQLFHDLQQTQLAAQLHMICVDQTPRARLPSFVRSMPTLVLGPTSHPLVGDQAFAWFDKHLHAARRSEMRPGASEAAAAPPMASPPSEGAAAAVGAAAAAGGDPSGWQNHEMGASYSDSYSFLSTSDTKMDAIPKNFEFVSGPVDVTNPFPNMGGASGGAGREHGGGGGGGRVDFSMAAPQMSPPTDELSAKMEQMRMERDTVAPRPTSRIG